MYGNLIMISSNLIETVRACAKDFGVKSVWLFGSALEDEEKATDIDLAVEGLVPEKFFDFYGRLFLSCPSRLTLSTSSRSRRLLPS